MVRVKQRYLLFSILYPSVPNGGPAIPQSMAFNQPSPSNLTRTSLAAIIRNSISYNFGDWGMGQAGSFVVKYFSGATSTGILRITRENYRILWAALTYIRELYGQPAVFKVVRVSGTIRKAELEAIKLAEETIRRVKREQKSMEANKSGRGVAAVFASGKASSAKKPQVATVEDEEDEMIVDIVDSSDDDDDEI
ncbi:hypothetical protein TWF694_009170 [Orbilia ellipsospora]|uniref:Uncharacterized protein n=1 Tax=Orbilia ellipsospora TaxID=2528407 RepID=A0AAV9XE39_9PEZI